MKFLKFSFLLVFGVALFSVTSCGDDGVDCSDTATANTEVNNAVERVSTTSTAYLADPTDSDACNDFKNATEDFIEIARKYEECVDAAELQDYQDNIKTAEDNIAMLDC